MKITQTLLATKGVIKFNWQETTKHPNAAKQLSVQSWKFNNGTLDSLIYFQTLGNYWKWNNTFPNLLEVIQSQNNSKPDITALWSVVNGKQILLYQDKYIRLILPNTAVNRLTGYISLGMESSLKNAIGRLSYSSPNELKQSISFVVKNDEVYKQLQNVNPKLFYVINRNDQEIRVDNLELWPEKGETYNTIPTGFFIEIIFPKELEIESILIEVKDDKLNWKSLIHPTFNFVSTYE